VGLLHVRFRHTNQTQKLTELVEYISSQIAASLTNLTLRTDLMNQSIRDPLTNLFNRRYLDETIEREISLAQRNKTNLSVIMIDIDHFKSFNDNHGHQAGDELLKAFAEFMRRTIRGSDIVCRYGGEEFIVVLPGSSLENAGERAEAVRRGMHHIRVEMQGIDLPAVTGSFGIAAYPENGNTWQDIVHMADEALYQAKQEGRDRTVISDISTPVP
jgi:diguanylate cyclase (GGDEF)-like protein